MYLEGSEKSRRAFDAYKRYCLEAITKPKRCHQAEIRSNDDHLRYSSDIEVKQMKNRAERF